eukprot:TRINITY_DN4195_c5_g1_i1.p1 TRINITY_DN4195_c5_g1~~TRINITY_DN4195_c5_g1_i1.p1  ORF type:complete len:1100 (-),score=242.74 TRINITY_DN4195_c5_g1_i1:2189-5488(-)
MAFNFSCSIKCTWGPIPSPRHSMLMFQKDKKIGVFGGVVANPSQDELDSIYFLDTETMRWEVIKTKGRAPSLKWRLPSFMAYGNNTLYVLAAKKDLGDDKSMFSSCCRCYVLDLTKPSDSLTWVRHDTTNSSVVPLLMNTLCLLEDNLVSYGGLGEFKNSCSKTSYLNINTWKWTVHPYKCPPNPGRINHSASANQKNLIVCGGKSIGIHNNMKYVPMDLHMLEPIDPADSNKTKWLFYNLSSPPKERDGHVLIVSDHFILIYGGKNDCKKVVEEYNDLYYIPYPDDTKCIFHRTMQCLEIRCPGLPTPRSYAGSVIFRSQDGDRKVEKCVIFGGSTKEQQSLNDIYFLHYSLEVPKANPPNKTPSNSIANNNGSAPTVSTSTPSNTNTTTTASTVKKNTSFSSTSSSYEILGENDLNDTLYIDYSKKKKKIKDDTSTTNTTTNTTTTNTNTTITNTTTASTDPNQKGSTNVSSQGESSNTTTRKKRTPSSKEHLSSLFDSYDIFCDVKFKLKNRYYYAHKIVLACSSPYFHDLYKQQIKKMHGGRTPKHTPYTTPRDKKNFKGDKSPKSPKIKTSKYVSSSSPSSSSPPTQSSTSKKTNGKSETKKKNGPLPLNMDMVSSDEVLLDCLPPLPSSDDERITDSESHYENDAEEQDDEKNNIVPKLKTKEEEEENMIVGDDDDDDSKIEEVVLSDRWDEKSFVKVMEYIYNGTIDIESKEESESISDIAFLYLLDDVLSACSSKDFPVSVKALDTDWKLKYLNMVGNPVGSDISFVLNNNYRIYAHKVMLYFNSLYFNKLIMEQPNQTYITLQNISPDVFLEYLKTIYTNFDSKSTQDSTNNDNNNGDSDLVSIPSVKEKIVGVICIAYKLKDNNLLKKYCSRSMLSEDTVGITYDLAKSLKLKQLEYESVEYIKSNISSMLIPKVDELKDNMLKYSSVGKWPKSLISVFSKGFESSEFKIISPLDFMWFSYLTGSSSLFKKISENIKNYLNEDNVLLVLIVYKAISTLTSSTTITTDSSNEVNSCCKEVLDISKKFLLDNLHCLQVGRVKRLRDQNVLCMFLLKKTNISGELTKMFDTADTKKRKVDSGVVDFAHLFAY